MTIEGRGDSRGGGGGRVRVDAICVLLMRGGVMLEGRGDFRMMG